MTLRSSEEICCWIPTNTSLLNVEGPLTDPWARYDNNASTKSERNFQFPVPCLACWARHAILSRSKDCVTSKETVKSGFERYLKFA